MSGKVIEAWNENLTEDNAVVDEGKNKLSDSEKEEYCKQYLRQLYHWIKKNKDFFYIPYKNELHKEDRLIGRYDEVHGDIQVTIPDNKGRNITWDIILNHLDATGQDFIEFGYEGKSLNSSRERCPITFEEIKQYCKDMIKLEEKNKQIPKTSYRGDVYTFIRSEIENMDLQEENK